MTDNALSLDRLCAKKKRCLIAPEVVHDQVVLKV